MPRHRTIPRDESFPRHERIEFRVSPEEKSKIEENARSSGMDTSEFIRTQCLAQQEPRKHLIRALSQMAENGHISVEQARALLDKCDNS